MASNFRIFVYQNSDNLHLKLSGEFDGSSAHKLIHTVKKYDGRTGKVFIHTSSLSSVHAFGMDVFKKNCSTNKLTSFLTFTGNYGGDMAPRGSSII